VRLLASATVVAVASVSMSAAQPGGRHPGATSASDAADERSLAIVGVTVVPMDAGRLLPHQTVIVRNGLIAEIGHATAVPIPASAERIDGVDMYLMPGLTDAHVHLRDPSELLSYLAHGVTTVVQLSGPSGTVSDVGRLREQVERGRLPGPTIYMSGRILDGEPAIFPGVSTVIRSPEQAERAVGAQLAAGADLIKVYNNLRVAELRAVARAARERGVPVWGHIPRIDGRATALQRSLAAGLGVIAHGEEVFFTFLHREVEAQLDRGVVPTVDEQSIAEAARLIREHDAVVIPTLSFIAMTRLQLDDIDALWTDPEARYLAPSVLELWRQQNPTNRGDLTRFDLRERGKRIVVKQLTRALSDAGATLLLGTDASAPGMFPGRSAWTELSELVDAGLTPFQALRTGTTNAGAVLRRLDHPGPPFGTVTVGSRADLLLLHANPLADISHIERIAGVVVRGMWYPRARIDSLRVANAGLEHTPARSQPFPCRPGTASRVSFR
jgi:imidazolonepropionase-like amidohydrolase